MVTSQCDADAGQEKKCVEKIVLEQETEWTQEVECHHRFVGWLCPQRAIVTRADCGRYRQHCYQSYVTAFTPVQEEECVDNYKKDCFIEYGIDAINQTVRICR